MRIGDIYHRRGLADGHGMTFVVMYVAGPYVYAKYKDHKKLRNAVIPRRQIDENTAEFKKLGYINLENTILDKLSRMEVQSIDRKRT